MKHDAKCAFIVGKRGAGKTTLLTALLKTNKRHIVTTTVPRDFKRGYIQCRSLNDIKAALKKNWNKGFKICFRMEHEAGDFDGPIKDLHDLSLFIQKVQDNYVKDIDSRRITLAVDEVTRQFPHNRPKGMDGFRTLILEGRNWGVNLVAATQRPTLIPPDFRDNVDDLFVLAVGGDNALEKVSEYVGREHKETVRALPKYRYLHFNDGQLIGQNDTKKPPS